MPTSSALIVLTLPKCTHKSNRPSVSVRLDNPAVRLYERLDLRRTSASPIINRVGTESIVMLLGFDQSDRGLGAIHLLAIDSLD